MFRLSSLNCARIYNLGLSTPFAYIRNNERAFAATSAGDDVPRNLNPTLLRSTDVLNGFFIYSLLLHKAEQGGFLILPHDFDQDRLNVALMERNKEMEGIGQEAYPHACDLCYVVVESGDRKCK